MSPVECWKCHRTIDGISKTSFRAACPHCSADLHACVNCKFYAPGKPNDCMVPGTEFIRDREAANFCEDFAIKTSEKNSSAKPSSEEIKKKLFGDD